MPNSGHRVQIDVTSYPPHVVIDGRRVNCVDYRLGSVSESRQTIMVELVAESIEIGGKITANDETVI